jgi:hypothetical protein
MRDQELDQFFHKRSVLASERLLRENRHKRSRGKALQIGIGAVGKPKR